MQRRACGASILRTLGTLLLGFSAWTWLPLASQARAEPSAEANNSASSPASKKLATAFVTVKGTNFMIGAKPYHFLGTNFWYGLNLGSSGLGGDVARLRRELDRLQALGVTNLRVMAMTEGPNDAPYRMLPALQPKPGQFDPQVFAGLDVLLAEMSQRGMRAVMCLGNFWQWSGGFAQYVAWTDGSSIPYPDHGNWDEFENYSAHFYSLPGARALYWQAAQAVITRINTVTQVAYKNDPTIFAWELANEPRGQNNADAYVDWISQTSASIKQLDPLHLVTTGSEGTTPFSTANTRAELVHSLPTIDYLTFHLWVQNFGWYDPAVPSTYPSALALAHSYIEQHIQLASRLGKPAVFEEFGIARDQGSYDPAAPTTVRDAYYRDLFTVTWDAARAGRPLMGINFWAWAGEARPVHPGGLWQSGNPFVGDPPHELQGWYSVYDQDAVTGALIHEFAARLSGL